MKNISFLLVILILMSCDKSGHEGIENFLINRNWIYISQYYAFYDESIYFNPDNSYRIISYNGIEKIEIRPGEYRSTVNGELKGVWSLDNNSINFKSAEIFIQLDTAYLNSNHHTIIQDFYNTANLNREQEWLIKKLSSDTLIINKDGLEYLFINHK